MKKEFEDIYSSILEELGTKFEKRFEIKKYFYSIGILFLISIILYNIFSFEIAGIFLIVGCFIVFYLIMKIQDKKIIAYKSILVSKIISNYNEKFNYTYKSDITEFDYRKSKFPEKFDDFKTTDQITGIILKDTNIKLARVVTKRTERKMYGENIKTEKIETYNGIYGMVHLNKMLSVDMLITSNDFKQKYNAKRIELDSEIFEKNFDCFADNKIVALQILTPDVIDCINEIYNTLKKPIQIRINGDMIYFRIFVDNLFVPSRVKKMLDKDRMKKLYNQIDSICTITNSLCENIYHNF